MAAPPEKTLHDLNGVWIMNKSLSGATKAVLKMQGVNMFLRNTISIATVTLRTEQFFKDGAEHIDIVQTLTGGVKGTTENRVLNYESRPHNDQVFGSVEGRSRWIKLADLPDDEDGKFMREGWDKATVEAGELIESFVERTDGSWTAWQTWGFETVNGERRYVRHAIVKNNGGEVMRIKLVYDWVGPL